MMTQVKNNHSEKKIKKSFINHSLCEVTGSMPTNCKNDM